MPEFNSTQNKLMKQTLTLYTAALLLPTLAFCADYNVGELAREKRIEFFNRTLDPAKVGSPEVVFLNAAVNNGVGWLKDVEFSEETIELEVKGKNRPGQSFVGIAFHGRDNQTFDVVYLRPFNFQAATPIQQSRSVQYVSIPGNDWNDLRSKHLGKYESAISPAPAPEPEPARWNEFFAKLIAFYASGETLPDEQVKAIRCPVLIIGGDKDFFNPVEVFVQTRAQIPNSRLLIVPDCDHVNSLQRPVVLKEFVLPFVTN
jgi:hypothetical protein